MTKSYLTKKYQYIKIRHKRSIKQNFNCDVTPSFLLGSLLIISYTNNLLSDLLFSLTLFVDDTLLPMTTKNQILLKKSQLRVETY